MGRAFLSWYASLFEDLSACAFGLSGFGVIGVSVGFAVKLGKEFSDASCLRSFSVKRDVRDV